MSSAPLILKHDETTVLHPSINQLALGELAINSVTGKLYTKVRPLGATEDVIFEFVGQPVCFSKMPIITFDVIDRFCCSGDVIKVKVTDLLDSNNYHFELEDISANGSEITVNEPIYTSYPKTNNGITIVYKEAVVPITVKINGQKTWTVFKFKVYGRNNDINAELTSKTISIACEN